VIESFDFTVVCGHRGREAQEEAFVKGLSKVHFPKSKHNTVPSMAVDLAPFVDGEVSWDTDHYPALATAVKAAWEAIPAEEKEGYTLSWGGDWARFVDLPHWEIRK